MDRADATRLSSPGIFLVRMILFLVITGFVGTLLWREIYQAFSANPALNGLIVGVLVIGIFIALFQVTRLFREVAWVNGFRAAQPRAAVDRPPVLLAAMAALIGDRIGQMAIGPTALRGILDSIGARLDEDRDISRYLTGLLVFLGLLGTFWGLTETVSSIGRTIAGLDVRGNEVSAIFDSLKAGLAAPLSGMATAFSTSLFGLAGSLVLGFLDLQAGQAQNRFYQELEEWLSTMTEVGNEAAPAAGATGPGTPASAELQAALERLAKTIQDSGSNKQVTAALANLAEGIQGLVQHMRQEQQMIRDWVEAQAAQQRETKRLLDLLAQRLNNER